MLNNDNGNVNDSNIKKPEIMKYSRYIKRNSTFKELNSIELSADKRIVISLKSDNGNNVSTDIKKISIAQAVTIIPEGKTDYCEIFYPHALTLSLAQAEEFVNKLNAEIVYLKKNNMIKGRK